MDNTTDKTGAPIMTVTDKLFALMSWKLNGLCMGPAYSWEPAYQVKKAEEYYLNSSNQLSINTFTLVELQSVSTDDLMKLGFRRWSDDDEYLIPLWFLPHLQTGTDLICIDGTKQSDDFDTDVRGGCIPYYFIHEYLPLAQMETLVTKLMEFSEDELAAAEAYANKDDPNPDGVVHPFRDDEHQ